MYFSICSQLPSLVRIFLQKLQIGKKPSNIFIFVDNCFWYLKVLSIRSEKKVNTVIRMRVLMPESHNVQGVIQNIVNTIRVSGSAIDRPNPHIFPLYHEARAIGIRKSTGNCTIGPVRKSIVIQIIESISQKSGRIFLFCSKIETDLFLKIDSIILVRTVGFTVEVQNQ